MTESNAERPLPPHPANPTTAEATAAAAINPIPYFLEKIIVTKLHISHETKKEIPLLLHVSFAGFKEND
jgi:hypothetical protein